MLKLSRVFGSILISFDFQLSRSSQFAGLPSQVALNIEDIHRKFEKRKLCLSTFGPNTEKSSFSKHFSFPTSR